MSNLQVVPASQIQRVQKVELRVPLYSFGCDRKIRNALSRIKGLHSVDVDFYQQKVTVTGLVNRDQVLAAIKAKRKNTQFWPSADRKEEHDMSGGTKGEIMEDAKKPAAASKKKKKERFQDILNLVSQQYQIVSYPTRDVCSADSGGDMKPG